MQGAIISPYNTLPEMVVFCLWLSLLGLLAKAEGNPTDSTSSPTTSSPTTVYNETNDTLPG